jgi:hypothetical protein
MATTVTFDTSKSPLQLIVVTDQHAGKVSGTVQVGSDTTPYSQSFVRNPITITDDSGAVWKQISDDLGVPQSRAVYSL